MYLERVDQIAFGNFANSEDHWLRVDADTSGVTFDRAGLCRLDRADCFALSAWLERTADKLPPPAAPPPVKKRRPGRGRPPGSSHARQNVGQE